MQTLHGDTLKDDYFWLRERENPEVRAYLEAENAYAEAFMKPTEGFQKTLYDEMLGRIKETDLTVPYRDGAVLLLLAHREGKAVPDLLPQEGQPRGARGDLSRRQRARRRASGS